MFFGPIVSLEMVTGARRARYFVVRVLYAAVLLAVLWINYVETLNYASMTSQGTMSIPAVAHFSNQFFGTFTYVQIIAVLLLTPAMIAGSIAQERERRTIEYMLASSLTSSEIVLSKFLARTLQVASLLVVGLPILAIAMTLGGIEPGLLVVAFAVTLATLAAVASLSIATSVWARRSRDAVVRAYVLLLLFLVLPPLLWLLHQASSAWLAEWPGRVLAWGAAITWVNPFYVLSMLHASRYLSAGGSPSPWHTVWPLAASYSVFSIGVVAWAIASVRRVYRKSIGAGSSTSRRGRLPRLRPRLGNRPMLWKELFAATASLHLGTLGRIAAALLFIASVVPAFLVLWHEMTTNYNRRELSSELVEISIFVVTLLQGAALLVVAVRAAGSITAEKERDSWLTLVSTPLEPAEIVWAKIAGSLYAARWFALPIGIWWLIDAIVIPAYLVMLPVFLVTFVCIGVPLAAVGVWFSSWCRTSIRAMASTVALGIFLGGGYLLCVVPLFIANDGGIFYLSACIPFLLAAPQMLWYELLQNSISADSFNTMYACLLGISGYIVLGVVFVRLNITGFDQRVGRPMRSRAAPAGQPITKGGAA